VLGALETCAAAAARRRMTIAIETHGAIARLPDGSLSHRHTVTTRRDCLQRLIAQMAPAVAFNYDPGNLKAADPADRRYAADLLAGRVSYCHLKD
jgi:sugar phosphate isomerase/epimerase